MSFDLFADDDDAKPIERPAVQEIQQHEKQVDENANNFAGLGISRNIVACLRAHSITVPTEVQRMALPQALNGKDCAIIAPTSSGKTLTFVLPILNALQQNPTFFHAIVLAPTRELAYQINEQISVLCTVFGLYSSLCIGGQDILRQNALLDEGCYVLVATPGRLVQVLQSRPKEDVKRRLRGLKFLILDEADQFLAGSPQFNADISRILDFLPPREERQTLLTTASLTPQMDELLRGSRFQRIQTETRMVQNLTYTTVVVPQSFYMTTYLAFCVEQLTGYQILFQSEAAQKESSYLNPAFHQAIIFCQNSEQTEMVNRILLKLGVSSTCLHGLLKMEQRIQNVNAFRAAQCRILCATDVAARGLDIPSVQLVINLSVPGTVEDFQHRAGRCARRQTTGEVLSLVEPEDFARLQAIEEKFAIQFTRLESIKNWTKAGEANKVDDEFIVRNYFAKIVRAEKEIKLDMLDQDIGHRIRRTQTPAK